MLSKYRQFAIMNGKHFASSAAETFSNYFTIYHHSESRKAATKEMIYFESQKHSLLGNINFVYIIFHARFLLQFKKTWVGIVFTPGEEEKIKLGMQ